MFVFVDRFWWTRQPTKHDVGHRQVNVGTAACDLMITAIGNMQGILVNRKTGTLSAGADPRRMMYAIGW